MNNSDSLCC